MKRVTLFPKRLHVAALVLLSLTGCATTRYVTTPCLTQQQLDELKRAEPPKVSERLTGKADEDIKVLGGSAVRLRGYAHGLLTVLGGCTK